MGEIITLAALFGLTAFILGIIRLQLKSLKSIYFIEIPMCLIWVVHFLLLGGLSGAITNTIAAIRALLRLTLPQSYIKPMILIALGVVWIISLMFYQNLFSLCPPIATTLVSVGMVSNERSVLTNFTLAHYIFWFIFGLGIGSSFLCSSVIMNAISCIIGKIRHEGLVLMRPSLAWRPQFVRLSVRPIQQYDQR